MGKSIKYHTMSEVYDAIKDLEGSHGSSPSLSVHKEDDSLLFVYVPCDRYDEIISVIEECNCRVTEEIERDNDSVMRICIGQDTQNSIYSTGYQKIEGQPNSMSATEVFEDMIN